MVRKRQEKIWERAAGMKPDPQKKKKSLACIEEVIAEDRKSVV